MNMGFDASFGRPRVGRAVLGEPRASVSSLWNARRFRGDGSRHLFAIAALLAFAPAWCGASQAVPQAEAFTEKYCANCHNDVDKEGGLDLTSLPQASADPATSLTWVKVHDRLQAGEMPPKEKKRPDPSELETFVKGLASSLNTLDRERVAQEGRATQRRLNRSEYENALRDVLHAPWLQVKDQLPEDGEAHRFNKVGDALEVSHVQLMRIMAAADYALRQAMSVQFDRPATKTTRYYARDERSLVRFMNVGFGLDQVSFPDRQTFPVLGTKAQPEVRRWKAPLTAGEADPETREQEAVGWVSSNYVTGFSSMWGNFKAPVAGTYRIRFSGYTLWAGPNGHAHRFASPDDKVGAPRPSEPYLPNYDDISPGRRHEPITIYTRGPVMNRRLGAFDLTPEPDVYELGEVWLLAGESIVTDASRFYRSRPIQPYPRNPLAEKDGIPSVAFRWMEIEGPLYDESSTASYRTLFGDLPVRKSEGGEAGAIADVVSANPKHDAERLLRSFIRRAYRHPAKETDVQRFIALFNERLAAGLGFADAMIASYTAVLSSPGFIYLEERAGALDDHALATRLALFLWNSVPDESLRARAERGELRRPEVLRAETERLLRDPKSRRFVEAFLDYWIDIRKFEDTTPSNTLYSDYYLDDMLLEAALEETRLFFGELLQHDLPARNIVDSDFTFLNEHLARHYGIPGVTGVAMRRVKLPDNRVRGGLMTQASVLKITANGTTTSPVLRGYWITERILGQQIPPPPPVAAVEPDIRGAVTIREQLEKHRSDRSCASCHRKMDPPGFALESFDVMGAWRGRYRAVSDDRSAEPGFGKNGHPFTFHHALPVDATGELPDGRTFRDIGDFKRLLLEDEAQIARNLARQLVVYATGAAVRFGDRKEIEAIVERAKQSEYGVRRMVHEIVQSQLFRHK